MTKEKAKESAYGLMLIIGTIIDEMHKGGIPPTKNEMDNMYDLAISLNEYFEEN